MTPAPSAAAGYAELNRCDRTLVGHVEHCLRHHSQLELRPLARVLINLVAGQHPQSRRVVVALDGGSNVNDQVPEAEVIRLLDLIGDRDIEQLTALQELEGDYVADLVTCGYHEFANLQYGFSTTPEGRPLSGAARRSYRKLIMQAEAADAPSAPRRHLLDTGCPSNSQHPIAPIAGCTRRRRP